MAARVGIILFPCLLHSELTNQRFRPACAGVTADRFSVNPVEDPAQCGEPLAQTDHRHYICEKYSLSLRKYRFGIMQRVAPGRALNL